MFAIVLAAILQLPPQVSDAVIGVSAVNLETGERLSVRNDERFPMGSVYKFPIALTVLQRADAGTLSLDRELTIEPKDFVRGWSPLRDRAKDKPIVLPVRELLMHMVSNSDNTASDALLKLVGGPTAVTKRLAELAAANIRVDRSETQMAADLHERGGVETYAIDARDTSTPEAMADLFAAFWKGRDGLSRQSHELLVTLLTRTTTGPHRMKAGLPAGATLAHKTGTMPGTTNDAGVITTADGQHIAIAIFAKASKRDKTEEAEKDIAAITRAVCAQLTRKP